MFQHRHLVRLVTGLLISCAPNAILAEKRETPAWQFGLDSTFELAAPFGGGDMAGRSQQAMVLAHLDWTPPGNSPGEADFRVHGSLLALSGHGPTERFAGDFLALSNIEGHRSARLYSCWLEHKIGSWEWRAGNLLADEDFAGTAPGGSFVNSAFGWPAFISANTVNTGPAFYVPAPGIRLKRETGADAYWQAGWYDGDSFDSRMGDPGVNAHGLGFDLGGRQGWFALVERGWTTSSVPARWKIGGWWHSARFDDTYADEAGNSAARSGRPVRSHSGNYGGYGSVEMTVSGRRGEPGHWEAFLRGGGAPGDRNLISWAVDTGLALTGPLANRPNDVVALGFARGTISGDARAGQRDAAPGQPAPDFEEVIELTYALELTGSATVHPSVQYIRHPGGRPDRAAGLVGLLRLEAKF